MGNAYIFDAVRTPRGIGKSGKGALAHLHPQHLASRVVELHRVADHCERLRRVTHAVHGGRLGRVAREP